MSRDRETVGKLSAYLDGETSTDERQALEAELRNQPGLQEQLRELEELDRSLAELPQLEPSPQWRPGACFDAWRVARSSGPRRVPL